jgi:hypothetical protein
MYHEEKIINGILHWRNTPNGEWIAYTAEQLSARCTELQAKSDKFKSALSDTVQQLVQWADESRSGGWSTHQVEPMRNKAKELSLIVCSR